MGGSDGGLPTINHPTACPFTKGMGADPAGKARIVVILICPPTPLSHSCCGEGVSSASLGSSHNWDNLNFLFCHSALQN